MSNRYRGRDRDSASWSRSSNKPPRHKAGRGEERDLDGAKHDNSHRDEGKNSGNGRQSPGSGHPRSENNKISSQVRVMARLESLDSFKRACQQIQDLLFYAENKQYMVRFFNTLSIQFTEAFMGLPSKYIISHLTFNFINVYFNAKMSYCFFLNLFTTHSFSAPLERRRY